MNHNFSNGGCKFNASPDTLDLESLSANSTLSGDRYDGVIGDFYVTGKAISVLYFPLCQKSIFVLRGRGFTYSIIDDNLTLPTAPVTTTERGNLDAQLLRSGKNRNTTAEFTATPFRLEDYLNALLHTLPQNTPSDLYVRALSYRSLC